MTAWRFTASLTLMYREFDLARAVAAAKADGFVGVELQNTEGLDVALVAAASRAEDLPIVLINAGLGDYTQGGLGLSGVPGREAAFERGFKRACELAGLWDCRFIHVGPSRVPEDATREECLATYRANVTRALRWRDAAGITAQLVIEQMNRVNAPTALVNDIEDAASLVDEFEGRVGLLFDAYHVAMNEGDPARALRRHIGRTAHIQFSDAPGRHEPGTGAIDFGAFFETVRDLDYRGPLGCEFVPTGPTSACLGWMARMPAWEGAIEKGEGAP